MESPLLQTVYNNGPRLYEDVKWFIARGFNLDEMTRYGESAIRVASSNGRFDVVELLISSGADTAPLQFSFSMYELLFGTLEKLQASLIFHNDLEAKDYWGRTPFLLAVQMGDIEKADALLASGANIHAVGRCEKSSMQYAIDSTNIQMIDFLLQRGISIEIRDEFLDTPLIYAAECGLTDATRFLLENNANPFALNNIPQRAIQVASNLDIVKLLVDAGDDLNDMAEEMHSLLVGIEHNGVPDITAEIFKKNSQRIFGNDNPQEIENPFWLAMVRSGATAWSAANSLKISSNSSPVWCYERYGRSTNILNDGRIIEIGGEHEDSYDPDFCIYNDVTVFDGEGGIRIFSYPEHIFPPTDFHTSTLLGDYIYIVGGLGYRHQRVIDETRVFRLNIETMKIDKVETYGEKPGWLYKHKSRLTDDVTIEVRDGLRLVSHGDSAKFIENKSKYKLCLETRMWSRSESN